MAALPRRWQDDLDDLTCRDCGGNLYGDCCASCGLCARCDEMDDDCRCETPAQERFDEALKRSENHA